MDVLLNDDENLIVDSAREFLDGECPTTLVRAMEIDPLGYPKDMWAKVAELGWQGMCLPEKVGGSNMPLVYLGLVLREAGRALAPLPLGTTRRPLSRMRVRALVRPRMSIRVAPASPPTLICALMPFCCAGSCWRMSPSVA